ncbi:uncharacterized protein M421DRAFT_227927 [Didymella exigua CBS 183.55]|uniref:Uncharacterized protein n=1 Tax=Didymella exigua CBS 183.55 TaxID=1150837 RepID=A0A6A5RF78_9PLEO|nr:uncharacterized protein M421DRAFT_227927 [Didymella exigua CBS 183.55]KAF1925950.1 hypothetical protein M421DRAFT_227927 [Didymella exigua CBS 183.55]
MTVVKLVGQLGAVPGLRSQAPTTLIGVPGLATARRPDVSLMHTAHTVNSMLHVLTIHCPAAGAKRKRCELSQATYQQSRVACCRPSPRPLSSSPPANKMTAAQLRSPHQRTRRPSWRNTHACPSILVLSPRIQVETKSSRTSSQTAASALPAPPNRAHLISQQRWLQRPLSCEGAAQRS